MSVTVTKNGVDITNKVNFPSLSVVQILTNEVDTATFSMLGTADALLKEDGGFLLQEDGTKFLFNPPPLFDENIVISDGASVIFAGKIAKVDQAFEYPREAAYTVSCVDNSFEMDRKLASRTYKNKTVTYIIADLVSSFAFGFTHVNAVCDFQIDKIVFNQVTLSQCLRRLATLVSYDWYVDENKDVHFFPATTNAAPFSLTDTAGNHVYKTLVRSLDSSQVVNRVRVRGGDYDGTSFTDIITVAGNDTTAFDLPYQMANLVIELDTGGGFVAKTVGIDFIDTFADFQVLYNFQAQSFRFATALTAGNRIRFTGNPKTPSVGVVEDTASVAQYGAIEKFVRDESIKSNAVARKRAAAELVTYVDGLVDARFSTYQAGLRTGMQIAVQAGGLGDSLLIQRVTFTARTPLTFQYDVQCVSSRRYGLIDLLRKIITPDASPTDEQEVSETLYPANDILSLSNSAALVTPLNAAPTVLSSVQIERFFPSGGTSTAIDCTGASMILVMIGYETGISSITYAGVPLALDVGPIGTYLTGIYQLVSPATGVNSLVINASSGAYTVLAVVVANTDTATPVIGTDSNSTVADHVTCAVSQPSSNKWAIGFMVRLAKNPPSFTPDSPLDVEMADYISGASPLANTVEMMYRVFTRSGTKAIGSTGAGAAAQSNAAMVLYNGKAYS